MEEKNLTKSNEPVEEQEEVVHQDVRQYVEALPAFAEFERERRMEHLNFGDW